MKTNNLQGKVTVEVIVQWETVPGGRVRRAIIEIPEPISLERYIKISPSKRGGFYGVAQVSKWERVKDAVFPWVKELVKAKLGEDYQGIYFVAEQIAEVAKELAEDDNEDDDAP